MSFERNWRRKQELVGRPIADGIYRTMFGEQVAISRMERDDQKILDVKFAIDVKLTLPTGQILLGQEKFLSHTYASFRSVTVEHFQNPLTKEPGDWFRLAVQFYFVGYLTADSQRFDPWILPNWPNVVVATCDGKIPWQDNKNKDGRARASFKWCSMPQFPSLPKQDVPPGRESVPLVTVSQSTPVPHHTPSPPTGIVRG